MAAPKAGKNIYIKTLAHDIKQGEEMVLIHYVRAYWYRNSLEDNPVWRYKVPDEPTHGTAKVIAPTRVAKRLRYPAMWPRSRCATTRRDNQSRRYHFA
ncbi:MAG TPA: hypothetical protein VNV82_18790 [Bryobacteraceae bacterium]|jgi:hypothetical protein|nr:hypothetical protein [Bryobacteraceae bacterium]